MKHKIEEAKTSRAACKAPKCKRKIEKGESKLLIESYNGFTPSGAAWKAYCTDCGLELLNKERTKLTRSIEKLTGAPPTVPPRDTICTIS